jgi:hypothetical protein
MKDFFLLLLFWIMCPFIITFGCLLLLVVGLGLWFLLAITWALEQIILCLKVCYRTLRTIF